MRFVTLIFYLLFLHGRLFGIYFSCVVVNIYMHVLCIHTRPCDFKCLRHHIADVQYEQYSGANMSFQ